ncbi:MAG TPA: hypothetical protein VG433_13640 [Pirellulales bacterium]|jgi:hypothetical protein|nr:hypothetical protein [Pirellulales bacterium]
MADPTTVSGSFDLGKTIASVAGSATTAFGEYETAQTAQAGLKNLSSSGTVYVMLGLGALALIGFAIFLRK